LAPGQDCNGWSKNLQVEELQQNIRPSRGVAPRVVQQHYAISEHPSPFFFFGSTSEAYSAFHNKPLTLFWSLVP
jgi:hypothetical protein